MSQLGIVTLLDLNVIANSYLQFNKKFIWILVEPNCGTASYKYSCTNLII